MYKLFLDDKRKPKEVGFHETDWILAESFYDAIEYVMSLGVPHTISFDHDLGDDSHGKTGFDFAKWLVEQDMNGDYLIPDEFWFTVHSANPVGAANIQSYLDNYLRVKNDN